jgi:hypothetical protein
MKRLFLAPSHIEKEKVIINPIVDISTILEKLEMKVVYIPYRGYYEVIPKTYVIPVYLPEIGTLLSLDIRSKNLAKRFYNEIRDFEGIISKGKIFLSHMYNFQHKINRVVSWGNIESFDLSEDIFRSYLTNLINDLTIMPSIVTREGIISPNRWFYMISTKYYKFQAFLNYNIGIVYLKKESLLKRKIKKVWINSPLTLYEVKAGFVILEPSGYIRYIEPIFIHFISDPLGIITTSNKGDYFLCFLISFNEYSTSYEKTDIKNRCINIVETLSELVFSPYDIFPFLFPFIIETRELTSLIFKFQVKKDVFLSFQKRLMKFGAQNLKLIDAYEYFIKCQNKALKIIETEDTYVVKIVNPIVIPFLVRKSYDPKIKGFEKSYAEKILRSPNFIEEIEEINAHFSEETAWRTHNFQPFWGIVRFLEPRNELMQKYVNIFRNFYKI